MTTTFAPPDARVPIGKEAVLRLRAARRGDRTELHPELRRIPYQWTGVYYQEDDDQAYGLLHNSGGGLVEGDLARLLLVAEQGTRVLLTTTAAAKFYKCEAGLTTVDSVELHAGPDALLEYIPDEAVPYANSRVRRTTRFLLDPASSLFASDVLSAGRIHHGGEAFAFASMSSTFEVRVGGTPILLERAVADGPADIAALRRLWGGGLHLGIVVAYDRHLPERVEDTLTERLAGIEGVKGAASRLGDLIAIRLVGAEVWRMHEAVFASWGVLRPALAGKPARRIRKP